MSTTLLVLHTTILGIGLFGHFERPTTRMSQEEKQKTECYRFIPVRRRSIPQRSFTEGSPVIKRGTLSFQRRKRKRGKQIEARWTYHFHSIPSCLLVMPNYHISFWQSKTTKAQQKKLPFLKWFFRPFLLTWQEKKQKDLKQTRWRFATCQSILCNFTPSDEKVIVVCTQTRPQQQRQR